MATTKRYFCTEHGFVHPEDQLVPMCPDCEAPVTELGGTSPRSGAVLGEG